MRERVILFPLALEGGEALAQHTELRVGLLARRADRSEQLGELDDDVAAPADQRLRRVELRQPRQQPGELDVQRVPARRRIGQDRFVLLRRVAVQPRGGDGRVPGRALQHQNLRYRPRFAHVGPISGRLGSAIALRTLALLIVNTHQRSSTSCRPNPTGAVSDAAHAAYSASGADRRAGRPTDRLLPGGAGRRGLLRGQRIASAPPHLDPCAQPDRPSGVGCEPADERGEVPLREAPCDAAADRFSIVGKPAPLARVRRRNVHRTSTRWYPGAYGARRAPARIWEIWAELWASARGRKCPICARNEGVSGSNPLVGSPPADSALRRAWRHDAGDGGEGVGVPPGPPGAG